MKKILLTICGWSLLALGAIGVVLPVLPTTPFVLLAAVCFSASSEKAYRFLVKNRFFGPYVENYRTGQGVPVSAKVRGIVMLWVLLLFAMAIMQKLWVLIVFPLIGTGVTLHLLLLRTKKPEKKIKQDPESVLAKKQG